MKKINMKHHILLMSILGFNLILISPLMASNHVVILAGAGGIDRFQKQFQTQASSLKKLLLTRYGYQESEISILTDTADATKEQSELSSAQKIRDLFRRLRFQLKKDDRLMIFLIGHGSFDGDWAKFNIPGPDLRDIDFADLLGRLPCKKIMFINTTSASGPFLASLSEKGRVVITATRSGIEKNATHFAGFLIKSLENRQEADMNKDGQLSATEAFVYARDQLVRYYEDEHQLRPEHPLLDDNGDGKGTETPDLLTGDGAIANQFYLEQDRGNLASSPTSSAAQQLNAKQKQILRQVQALQTRKGEMPEEEYYQKFEKLMIELAKLNKKSQSSPNPSPRKKQ